MEVIKILYLLCIQNKRNILVRVRITITSKQRRSVLVLDLDKMVVL